jgi:hypothetical protein
MQKRSKAGLCCSERVCRRQAAASTAPSGQAKLASELVLVRSYLIADGIMIPMAGWISAIRA